MKLVDLSFAIALGTLASGLIAAWFWFKASRIKFDGHRFRDELTKLMHMCNESFEDSRKSLKHYMMYSNMDDAQTLGFIADLVAEGNVAFADSARLNAIAAVWTGISVLLGAAASITGSLAN